MARVLRSGEHVVVTIQDDDGPVVFKMRPLTAKQKAIIIGHSRMVQGVPTQDRALMVMDALRFSVKEVSGIFYDQARQEPMALQFNTDGTLVEECVDQLLNMTVTEKLVGAAMVLVNGLGPELADLAKLGVQVHLPGDVDPAAAVPNP